MWNKYSFYECRHKVDRFLNIMLMILMAWVDKGEYLLCVHRCQADWMLNITLLIQMAQADVERIFLLCRLVLGGCDIKYYVDDTEGLGGCRINIHSVNGGVRWMGSWILCLF